MSKQFLIKMNTIDLNKIITDHDLDVKELAAELFPGIKYPKLALDRVLKGESYLDTNQLSRLSLYTGQPIETLMTGKNWIALAYNKENAIVFESGDYRAELDLMTWITKLFHKNSIFHESVITKSTIPLNEYLEQISNLIDNHNHNQ